MTPRISDSPFTVISDMPPRHPNNEDEEEDEDENGDNKEEEQPVVREPDEE